jgi:predicted nucleotidyltransferase component of viral defense system
MEKDYYFKKLYPFQDTIFQLLGKIDTEFYLTGGTAASRGYLNHRFSDDLDFFVNDDTHFGLWVERIINAFAKESHYKLEIVMKEERFSRLILEEADVTLKIELINDVPSHIGAISMHAVLGRLDSADNILANKITAAIDRQEPKDLADIWAFCRKMNLSLHKAITDAHSKAAGIFPADIARILCSANQNDWKTIKWIDPPDCKIFLEDLRKIGESLIIQ